MEISTQKADFMFLIFLTPVHPPQKFEKITVKTFVND